MQVNFYGVIYAINAVLPGMLQRGSGHIVGMSSLAASRGIPYEAAYGASKAALGNYLESLRPGLRQRGIATTTVYAGFVRTPLLDKAVGRLRFQTPFLGWLTRLFGPGIVGVVEPEAAVKKITAGILARHRHVVFPFSTRLLSCLGYWTPPVIYDWVMAQTAARVILNGKSEPPELYLPESQLDAPALEVAP
jgi:short-subunit dehydrogenase